PRADETRGAQPGLRALRRRADALLDALDVPRRDLGERGEIAETGVRRLLAGHLRLLIRGLADLGQRRHVEVHLVVLFAVRHRRGGHPAAAGAVALDELRGVDARAGERVVETHLDVLHRRPADVGLTPSLPVGGVLERHLRDALVGLGLVDLGAAGATLLEAELHRIGAIEPGAVRALLTEIRTGGVTDHEQRAEDL